MALHHPQSAPHSPTRLTPREREVVGYLLQGRANKFIALDLGISLRTVEAHRSRIFHKLGVRHAVELAHWFYAVAEPAAAEVYSQRVAACLSTLDSSPNVAPDPAPDRHPDRPRDQLQLGCALPSSSLIGSKSG
ncbi:MAG: response regulator transcription factor [Burkholderiaceae bacterium]|nr:response regulator transcription factor [Burkholderiaceae bacterium]